MEEAVCLMSDDGNVFYANDRLGTMCRRPMDDIFGHAFLGLFSEACAEDLRTAVAHAKKEGLGKTHATIPQNDTGAVTPVFVRLIRYSADGDDTPRVFAMMLDLSELAQALRALHLLEQRNRELEDLAITCPLTGVYNRRYLDFRYSEEMKRARRYKHGLAVAMVDIDHFKQVNDKYGHLAGDQVLREVAAVLQKSLRVTDIVARFGGEEFLLLMPEIRPEAALAVSLRIRMAIQGMVVDTVSGPVSVTVSIGVACINPPEEVPDDETLIQRADESLYEAKRSGRNRVILWGHPVE